MDPNIFRKGDAKSVLVIEQPWGKVLDKPALFDEMATRLLDMMEAAEDKGILLRSDTLRELKRVITSVLINPLKDPLPDEETVEEYTDNIPVDAFWDEIPGVPARLSEALERLNLMMTRINENMDNKLDRKSTLMDAKDIVNETVLKPLNNINEDE